MNRGSSSSTTPTRLLRAGGSLAYHGDRSSRVYGDDDVERRERARGILREIRKTRRVRETAAAIDSRECVFAQEPRWSIIAATSPAACRAPSSATSASPPQYTAALPGAHATSAAAHSAMNSRVFATFLVRQGNVLRRDAVGFSLVVVAREVREESVGTFPRSIVRHDERGDASESVGARSIERASFRGA